MLIGTHQMQHSWALRAQFNLAAKEFYLNCRAPNKW